MRPAHCPATEVLSGGHPDVEVLPVLIEAREFHDPPRAALGVVVDEGARAQGCGEREVHESPRPMRCARRPNGTGHSVLRTSGCPGLPHIPMHRMGVRHEVRADE